MNIPIEKPPSAVIFDMDGILFDTERTTARFWDIAGQKFGYRIPLEIVYKMIGINSKKARIIMAEEYGNDFPFDNIVDEIRVLSKKDIEENGVVKKPGLDYILRRLIEAKISFGLATSTRRERALFMLEKAGILNLFKAITGGDEVENGKPAPDIFLNVAEKLGVKPCDCAGLEDSPAGLQSLHAAGIRSIFIKDLIEPPQNVLATVWRRCSDLFEAADFLIDN